MIAVWFSCGAASAVAAKLTLEKYGNSEEIRVIYNPVKEEHDDNLRFLKDVEKWIGIDIEFAINSNYPSCSAVDVWKKRKFMSSIQGAACTMQLKKQARIQWEENNDADWHVLGFTNEEKKRHERFILTERDNILPVLIDHDFSKQDCFDYLIENDIKPPEMYYLGFPNANCLGCIKVTSPTYWNHLRKTHPDIFKQRAEQSRELGVRLTRVKGKRIFLDELDPDYVGNSMKNINIDCGSFCEERL